MSKPTADRRRMIYVSSRKQRKVERKVENAAGVQRANYAKEFSEAALERVEPPDNKWETDGQIDDASYAEVIRRALDVPAGLVGPPRRGSAAPKDGVG